MNIPHKQGKVPLERKASLLSLWLCPFPGFLILGAVATIREVGYGRAHKVTLLICAACVPWCTGIVLAVLGLLGIKHHGRTGIFWRATLGMIVNGILLVAGGFSIWYGISTQREIRELADIEAARIQNRLRPGDDLQAALADYADSSFSAKINALFQEYQKSAAILTNSAMASPESFKTKSDVVAAQQRASLFLENSMQMREFYNRADLLYKAELLNHKLTPEQRSAMQLDFENRAFAKRELAQKVRDADVRLATALQSIFKLLENRWGAWRWSPKEQKVLFNDAKDGAEMNRLLKEYSTACREERRQVRELSAGDQPPHPVKTESNR